MKLDELIQEGERLHANRAAAVGPAGGLEQVAGGSSGAQPRLDLVGQFQRVRRLLGALGRADENRPFARQVPLQPERDFFGLLFSACRKASLAVGKAGITFLGFGLPPEMPAIGIILSEAMGYLSAGLWWLAVFPGLALVVCVMLFDVVGTSLRKLVDPAYAQE